MQAPSSHVSTGASASTSASAGRSASAAGSDSAGATTGSAADPVRWTLTFPDELPVSERRADIADAIRDHQVVIVAGETGSGKTTQLPKICLELGRGQGGAVVGHTQPRRIAARSVAERIADELETVLGDVVGYKIRFTDRSSDSTIVKVMTDGILLAEIQRDRSLRRYDTIIIDEAHERSLNVDFILGYLKQLLPRRPDLKVIITSATIDPQRFSRHFDDAPVIEVSGRMYPVEVRYREPVDDQPAGIVDAVVELTREGPGDILVFLSGEREIRDAAEALAGLKAARATDTLEVLPLYARLSAADQHRVFAPHSRRRVVLATNVAETSLTVPGIRYVVDTGLARVSRFSSRTKVQRLPIEPISQASASQRAGRCGRVADGICIRLYTEEDLLARAAFTDPEILRTNLAAVILQMTSLGLGDVARFPFVEPPDTRAVQAGTQLLEEIGALAPALPQGRSGPGRTAGRRTGRSTLTPIGRQLAQLPIDPRLGRMLVEASRLGSLREVIVVTAALSMQDPRERPSDQQEQADRMHRTFADPDSDFAGILNLWRHLKEQQQELSSSAFRRMCKRSFLNYLRVREWQDLDAQLRQVARQLGLSLNSTAAASEPIHKALLAGLLSHIGLRDGERRDYLGARGTRFAIFPGSALFKKPPEFVMAAELVETARLWGRVNARLDPAWVEEVGAHLLRRTYSEPHWEKNRGAVTAQELVTLYGVPIVADRAVNYGRIDAEASRDLFIRHALVQGEWRTHHAFFAHNQALLEDAEDLEHRARRRDIVVDEESLFEFYDERVPAHVVSSAHFDSWWKGEQRTRPDLLSFSPDMLVHDTAAAVSADDFPAHWQHGNAVLPLDYAFEPGTRDDGVTVDIPVAALDTVEADDFTWPVPGMRLDLVVALLRSLPKRLRVGFVPAPNVARAFLAATTPGEEPLLDAFERYLLRTTGHVVPRDAWDLDKVPDHLRLSFRVRDGDGAVLGVGKDLEDLRRSFVSSNERSVASAAKSLERTAMTTWELKDVPREFAQVRAGHRVVGYPALVDEGSSVGLKVFATASVQATAMRAGVRRLGCLAVASPAADVVAELDNQATLSLGLNPHGSTAALLADCWACAVDSLIDDAGGPPWNRRGFQDLVALLEAGGRERTREVIDVTRSALVAAHQVGRRLSGRAELALLPALTDLADERARMVYPGFVTDAGLVALRHYPRYCAAMEARLDRLAGDVRRDAVLMATVAGPQAAYLNRLAALPPGEPPDETLRSVRWMLEELRVSLWAQHLTTAQPVSVQRIERALRKT
ncbi:MAG: ATP-dependent RNA helicase HrpA [Nocardioidaceae bacterium]